MKDTKVPRKFIAMFPFMSKINYALLSLKRIWLILYHKLKKYLNKRWLLKVKQNEKSTRNWNIL